MALQRMDDNEHKQWLVGRIEYLLETCSDELNSKRAQFEILSNRSLTKWNEARTIILGSVAFVATIALTLLGIDVYSLERDRIVTILGADVGVGVVAASVLFIVRESASKKLDNITTELLSLESQINYLKGYFAKWLLDIKSVDAEDLKTFFTFSTIVYGNRKCLHDAYQKGLDSHLFWGIKADIKLERDIQESVIQREASEYTKNKSQISSCKTLPKEALEFIENLGK